MYKKRILSVPALFLLGTFALAPASAATIDFENPGLVAGTNVTNQIPGVTISAMGGVLNQAWIFDTENPTGNDDDLAAGFDEINGLATDFHPGNVLIIQENGLSTEPDDLGSAGGMFSIVFDIATTLFSIDFFDMEPDTLIELFNSSSILVADFETLDSDTSNSTTPNLYEHLVFNGSDGVSGVKRIKITMAGSGAIDNIVHSTSVPLPATLWLFVAALVSLLGLSYRQRGLEAV